jgi:poly(A) polymerase
VIRRLLARLIPGRPATAPRVFGPDAHPVRRSQLSRGAADVIRRLQHAGFKAFVVGGAVRDLLLAIVPKDFDIATDATPEQIKPLFRRAFIIGRRFRLVHVLSGPETVEVSTFRGQQTGDDASDEHGRLLHDNVFGKQAEDAVRRDFTINALYFDPTTDSVWDYIDGMHDIKTRKLRLIGDPVTRYREDPVRMLRAVRLAAKLGIDIEKKTAAPIPALAPLLHNVPPSRLFDEMEKLLLSGHAVESLKSLRRHGLHHGVLPLLDVIVEQPLGQRFIDLALANTDERVRTAKPVTSAFLFATLLWHEVLASWNAAKAKGERSIPALFTAMDRVLEQQAERLAIPRRFEAAIKETWALQPRLEQRAGQRPFRLLEHPRFRAAYDFLRLRADSGEIPVELADWWERFQQAGSAERERMLRPDEAPRKRRRPRGRGRKRNETAPDSSGVPSASEQ